MRRTAKPALLLADEVGVGKTLSLAASAMVSVLLDDGPVLILCPSTLTLQWQVELKDKLGIPERRLVFRRKRFGLDQKGHIIKTRGAGRHHAMPIPDRHRLDRTDLPRLGQSGSYLLERKYGTVILDEAHKARRRGGLGEKKDEPNNLLEFMLRIGLRTKNLLLGTATPIQTEVYELWDLMSILNSGADFVLGREALSRWPDLGRALPVVKGEEIAGTSATRGSGFVIRCRLQTRMHYLLCCGCSWNYLIKSFSQTVVSVHSGSWSNRPWDKPFARFSSRA